MELTRKQVDFIIDSFRIITNTDFAQLKASGHFDGYNADSVYETADEIEEILAKG